MDDWIPRNAGNTVAGGDGAFERFITAAVAAIITIMFSWRLLAEQSEGGEEGGAVGGMRIEDATVQVRGELEKELSRYKQQQQMAATTSANREIPKLSVGKGEGVSEGKSRDLEGVAMSEEEPKIQDISLDEFRINNLLSLEALKKWPSMETNDVDSGFDSNRWVAQEAESSPIHNNNSKDGQVNSAFKDFMDEEFHAFNEFDPFGNSDPFDDNIEPRVLDSDEEMYCCNMLETIMEEDSDEIPSSGSDTESLKRFDHRRFRKEELQSDSDIDSLKHDTSENETGSLKRYVTRKLESDELLEAVVPEQTTNEISDSDEDDEEESGSSTSHVTLFTRETISITDSDGNLERTNVVHKVNIPVTGDCTLQQLMSRVPQYPIEQSEETNSSGSDESIVTVLTRQNSTSTIDSTGSPKMIENVTGMSSAFPAFAPGNHSDEYRSDDNSSTRQPDAGKHASITDKSPFYNTNVTKPQVVRIPPSSSWSLGVNDTSGKSSSSKTPEENGVKLTGNASASVTPVTGNEVPGIHSNGKQASENKSDQGSISVEPATLHDSQHGDYDTSYKQRISELFNRHNTALTSALQNKPLVAQQIGELPNVNDNVVKSLVNTTLSRDNRVHSATGDIDNSGHVQTSESNVIDNNSEQDKHVNSEYVVTNSGSFQTNNKEDDTNNSNRSLQETSDRVKYVDAYESTAVKNSPQSFTFTTCKSQFVDYHQKNYTQDRDPDDIQTIEDNLEQVAPIPVPRKRLSIGSKVDSEPDCEPVAKLKKGEESPNNRPNQLKLIKPIETDLDFVNDHDFNSQLKQNRYLKRSDTIGTEITVDRSFDDDDVENIACLEEVIGSIHSDSSPKPKLEIDIDNRFDSPGTAKKARLETNIDHVFEDNNNSHDNKNGNEEEDNDSWGEELVEVYDETTGRWILQAPDGAPKEYLNDVPGVGESEREIFLRRCIRQSNDDEEPVDFLDFSRGVEESPPDGGSPVRTSSPLTVINDRPKTSFRILSPTSTNIEPVLKEASEKLTRRASVEDSPVVKITAQKPTVLKDKQNVKNSITTPGESSPVRPKQQTVTRRQKSRETTFGPEPNLSSKETTFGPEPPQSSIKETTFGAESEEPKPKAKETTFSPSSVKKQSIGEALKPKVKETTFSSPTEKRQSNGDSAINEQFRQKGKDNSKRIKSEQSHSVKFQEVKSNEHKGKFHERVKPKNLELDVKTHTTIERDNPFRINTPDRQKNANFNIQVNNSPENVNISSKSKEIKETLIDDPSPISTESKETNIDDPLPSIDTDNPFRVESPQEHIESTYQIPESGPSLIIDKGPFVKIKVKETVIDDPAPSLPKETVIDEPAPPLSNQPTKLKAADHRSPTIEYRSSFQTLSSSSSKETLIDDPSPVIQLPRKQVQETSIDEPRPTNVNKNTPVRKSNSRETIIDEPSPVIKLPSKSNQRIEEARIGAPAVFVQSSPIVTSPTIKSPTIKLPPAKVSLSKNLSKSKETLIDDPSPNLEKHSTVQIRAIKETLIDDPAPSIEAGPVLKPPTKHQQTSAAALTPHQNYKETSINDPLPNIPTPHSWATSIDAPSIKLETSPSVKPPPKETSIDEPSQSFQSTIYSPSITLPQRPAKKEAPGKVTEGAIDWQGVQLPSKVKETLIDEPAAVIQTSPIVKPPPKETSIDDDPIISKVVDTSTNLSVQSSQITETLIDPPDNELQVTTGRPNKSSEVPRRPIETSIDEPGVNVETSPAANGTQNWETTTDDTSLDSNSIDAHPQDSLIAESPRSSVTSFSTSVSSVDQGLTIDTRSRIKLKPNPVDQNFISGDLASPNSHPSDIDDHNVTGPTSPEITSSEDWNNSYDSYDLTSQSQADDSAADSSLSEAQKKPRSLRQIKRKIAQHRAYKSALQSGVPLTSAQLSAHTNREDIIASRLRFLSEGNLSKSEQQEHQKKLFDDYKKHLLSPLPKIGTFQPNKRYRSKSSFSSVEKLQHITDLYASRIDSDESFTKPHVHELHKNCILSPEGRREIHDKTLSIENLNLQLRQFGSATSLQDTDLDTWKTSGESGFPETDLDFSLYLQQPSDRAVSMTDLRSERIPRKSGNRRFADRHLAPKSKSLQTLETNIDDEDDDVFPDTISRTPSVHELRVTKSLSKLNVPDWYKHSNLTKSASTILRRDSTSTMSSFGYSAFSPSIISSPCPSVTSQSGNVVIKTRVTPSSSSRIFRKYTPATAAQEEYRRSVLNNKSKSTPNVRLPSEKYREKEKPKGLMPVPILSFKQLRAMFEAKAANAKAETKDTEKPKSPELGKKEQLVIPTVTFSDDESAPESPKNSESSSPCPTSPVSPSSPTRPGPPEIQTATVKAPPERRLPKPILKISEHFARVTKSKTVSEPPRVKTPEPKETIIPASNIEVEATINIPESAVIKRPVTEITEVQRVPDTNSRPEPKPRSFDSTTRTPGPNPPPPSVNVSNSNDKTPSSVNNDKPAAIRLGNSNNQSHKIQPVPSTSLFARAKASFTSGRSVKETTV
ncbi:uncharacterized protein LOC126812215 isoform X2 [Patella vulgata]|uniref:uncharacterized protein LOC126812215 isoform X2 n=1 Tax=Patella vulgata TaxID=6465 RepID=UPI00217F9D43|nr:uncharacterized protein LOC126812215 isoform X2 [Patella vulgata]